MIGRTDCDSKCVMDGWKRLAAEVLRLAVLEGTEESRYFLRTEWAWELGALCGCDEILGKAAERRKAVRSQRPFLSVEFISSNYRIEKELVDYVAEALSMVAGSNCHGNKIIARKDVAELVRLCRFDLNNAGE